MCSTRAPSARRRGAFDRGLLGRVGWLWAVIGGGGCVDAKVDLRGPVTVAPSQGETSTESVATGPKTTSDHDWQLVARSELRFQLHAIDGATFVSSGPMLGRLTAAGQVDRDPALSRGIATFAGSDAYAMVGTERWEVLTLGGRWPEETFLVTHAALGAADALALAPWVHRWDGTSWQQRTLGRRGQKWIPERVRTWKDGNMLALRRSVRGERIPGREIVVVRGPAQAPEFGRRTVTAFDARASGEIYAVSDERWMVVEYRDGTISEQPLPHAEGGHAELDVAAAEPGIVVFGGIRESDERTRPYLATQRANGWKLDQAPPCETPIRSIAWQDETLWAVCGRDDEVSAPWKGQLFFRTSGGWQPSVLPQSHLPAHVAVSGDVVWVTSFDDEAGEGVLYRSGRPSDVAVDRWPSLEAMHHTLLEWGDVRPTEDCERMTFVLNARAIDGPAVSAKLGPGMDKLARNSAIKLVEATYRGAPALLLVADNDRKHKRRDLEAALAEAGLTHADPVCFEPRATIRDEIAAWARW